jgi:hypothetical protein
MMAVFTYRGKRVMCASLLPVKGKASLVQGKDNVKDPMKKPPPHVEAVMQGMAARLWLGKNCIPDNEVYGPFDMEIHEVDGSLYMIDAARLFPPEYRKGINPGTRFLYQLLRPELLRKARKPLIPDALSNAPQHLEARRDLAEVSNMLDVEIAELARELAAGQHSDRISSRNGVKALFHSRGINMRHLSELVMLLDVACAARSQLQRVLDWRRPAEEVDVKTLSHPRQQSREELESVLKLQAESLKDGYQMQLVPTLLQLSDVVSVLKLQAESLKDGYQMQLVPTLLQLSDVVGGAMQLEREQLEGFKPGKFRPSGTHPLVKAWEICEKFDLEFVRDIKGSSVTACSSQTLLVMYEILRRDNAFRYPREYDLELLNRRAQTAMTARIDRCCFYILSSFLDPDRLAGLSR